MKTTLHSPHAFTRRGFLSALAASTAAQALGAQPVRLRHIIASCLYGTMLLEEILPELRKLGCTHIDLWSRKHGDQREQVAEMGDAAFEALLAKHGAKLGCVTRYDLDAEKLAPEMNWAREFGCPCIVTSAKGPKGLKGEELREAVEKFAEEMKPLCEVAEETDVRIAIENHGSGLLESPDAIRWFVEAAPSPMLGVALAPYHLPQDEADLASLIRTCGEQLFVFYAWQHGKGCMAPQPKDDELLQLPGRGSLDFGPLVDALREIGFAGWTSIFMHPFPRGIPIVEGGAGAVTAELNRARTYLEKLR